MADYGIPKSGVAYIFYGCLVSQADTKLFKSAPTLAAGDFKVSIDGGAFANLATLPTNTPGTYAVKFSLSAGEMTGDNILVVASDAAGAEWCDQCWNIQTSPRGIADLAYPATSGRSMVVDAAGLVDSNVVKVGPTGSGTAQTAGDIIADTNDIQTRLPAALVSGRMDSSVGAMAANTLTAAATAADFGAEMATAVWTDTTAGDFTVAASVGKSVMNGVSLGTGLTVAAVSGAVGSVTGAVGSVTGNVGGNVVGSVGSVTGAVGSVTGLTASDVAAIKAKTDNLPAAPAATSDIPSAASIASATMTTAVAESYRADGATGTPAQLLYEVVAHLGESSIAGTTKTIKKVDGTTTAATFTLDDAVTPTSITRAT